MNRRQTGMTLLELMMVVAVVGILAAVAYPSYRDQMRRANRAEAKIALEERAQAFEKCFTRTMDYSNGACDNAAASGNTPKGHYTVAIVAGTRTATTFTLQATAQGAQATDAECMNFTLNQAGARGISGSGTVQRCW